MKRIPNDVTVQIFSGGFLRETTTFEDVEKKLSSILPRLPVSKVIMGWSPDKALYEKTASLLVKKNIGFYLWFPVFSETGVLEKLGALVDYQSRQTDSRGEQSDEDFDFCCPNNKHNIEKILAIFDQKYASIPFTGVFLDKIRYPSSANAGGSGNGFRSTCTCFCPDCLAFYKKENVDVDRLKAALARPADLPFGVSAYKGNGEYTFDDSIIYDFFQLKARILYKSLERICTHFREKGLGIGFDVFAPFLSAFAGQDLPALSGLCDFIKPMMYRATNAPAGIPFEAEALLRETGAANRAGFYRALGINSESMPFDRDFAARDLQNFCSASACPVYAGIEINRKKDIADIYPDYIEETIMAFSGTGIVGFALSWNLLDAPEENIVKAAGIIKK